ncbi:MAG: hypothetical protein N4A72_15595 [Bacteroidales bacterium]|jgi:hypothetical protein|nr:hypothetical protein [Bacteroidales bacterium]
MADSLADIKEYKEALINYKQAFETVDYVHAENLRKASVCAIECDDFNKAYLYAKQSVINGGERYIFKRIKRRKFKRTDYYRRLKDSIDYFMELHNERVNQSYKNIIDSLEYVDQVIIRGAKDKSRHYNIDITTLPLNRFDLDSCNMNLLLHLFDKYGFPSEKILGEDSYFMANTLIHHNFRKVENEKYHKMIFEAIIKGEYNPLFFSWWYDQFYQSKKSEPYFTLFGMQKSEENINRVNNRRRKFFLPDLK